MNSTISDISKMTGLSKGTISGILNNKSGFSEKTRKKVFSAVEELGYIPNEIAKGLSSKSTRTIGLIIKDITNPYYNQLTKGVQEIAEKYDFTVFLCSSGEDQSSEIEHIRVMERKRVDGMIIAPLLEEVSFEHFHKLKQKGLPFVLLGEIQGLDADYVKFDDYNGALQVMDHLLQMGHQNIAYIKGPNTSRSNKERLQAYYDKLNSINKKITVYEYPKNNNDIEIILNHITQINIEDRPSAIVAFDDLIAAQLIKASQGKKTLIPDQLSIVGFDDIEWIAFPLTSVSIPTYDAGKLLAETLMTKIIHKDSTTSLKHTFEEKLVIRSSVKQLS